jgi:hypothetical protein
LVEFISISPCRDWHRARGVSVQSQNIFQLPHVQRATTEQSDESHGNQVKGDDVVQQPWNDQN